MINLQNNFSLIITLDCGIKAINQVDLLAKKKIDVIICDHHQPSNILPEAYSILNPKQKTGLQFLSILCISDRQKCRHLKNDQVWSPFLQIQIK